MIPPEFQALGEHAVLATFVTELDAAQWARAVQGAHLIGVASVVLAYSAVAVHADPTQIDDWDTWFDSLRAVVVQPVAVDRAGRIHRIPVWYGGFDLAEVARIVDLAETEVVALHAGQDYQVFAVGFQPGFPYAGYLPERLSGIPRRSSPRSKVPAGSVAIAGRQTGIYPITSPGGWHLLGQTPCRIVDLTTGSFPIEPGDLLRFEPIEQAEFERLQPLGVGPTEASPEPRRV